MEENVYPQKLRYTYIYWNQSAEAAHAAPPLVSSYVLSDIEQPAAVPDPSEDAKVACVYKHGGWALHL